ncbi:MAG: hypothetical protein Q9166_000623 [cf. Caloplaca sp. 2 TL-2023]
MSYSIVAFLWRKPSLTPDEFRHYYETQHIPLLLDLMGPTFPKSHTRFYLPRMQQSPTATDGPNDYKPVIFAGSVDALDYDAFASIVFEDEEAFGEFHARLKDPEVAKVLREDEEKFQLRQRLVVAAAGAPFVTVAPETHEGK